VVERPLSDGRAEVMVLLHTKNALTWWWNWNRWCSRLTVQRLPRLWPPCPRRITGKGPALGESFLKWVFVNDAPGHPLRDYWLNSCGPTVETIMLSFQAHADGTLREAFGVPDGTPGRAQVTEIENGATVTDGRQNTSI